MNISDNLVNKFNLTELNIQYLLQGLAIIKKNHPPYYKFNTKKSICYFCAETCQEMIKPKNDNNQPKYTDCKVNKTLICRFVGFNLF